MRPVLVVNPRADASFVEFVREQTDDLLDREPLALEQRLRARFPNATVHMRLLSREPDTVWYVYREGRWIPSR